MIMMIDWRELRYLLLASFHDIAGSWTFRVTLHWPSFRMSRVSLTVEQDLANLCA